MKKISLLLLLCVGFYSVNAQEIYNSSGKKGNAQYKKNAEKKGFDPHKLIFGGGFGGGLASGVAAVSVSPIIGYRITDHFSSGLRLGYQYNWIKNRQYYINGINGNTEAKNLNYHVISPGIWSRLVVWNNLFLHTEYELNSFNYKAYQTSPTPPGYTAFRVQDKAHSLLVGAGFRQPVTANSSIIFEFYYDALQNIPANIRTDQTGQQYSISPYAGRFIDFRIGYVVGF